MSHRVEHHQFLTGREVKKGDSGRGGDGKGVTKGNGMSPFAFSRGDMTSALNNRPEEGKEVGG
jgi:hypothetical protein